jgi:hypothetical protein
MIASAILQLKAIIALVIPTWMQELTSTGLAVAVNASLTFSSALRTFRTAPATGRAAFPDADPVHCFQVSITLIMVAGWLAYVPTSHAFVVHTLGVLSRALRMSGAAFFTNLSTLWFLTLSIHHDQPFSTSWSACMT